MTAPLMRWISRIVVNHPVLVVAAACALTLFLYSHIHNLRMATDLTDMFGKDDPEWKPLSQMGRELGYGKQHFVLIETPKPDGESAGAMEALADRLVDEMNRSGLFRTVRCGLREDELLNMARLFAWNFPAFVAPAQSAELKKRLEPREIRETVRQASRERVTAFSRLGTDYFVADPIGLAEVAAKGQKGFDQFGNFDLSWGGGNRFFSRDHKALLIVAEPLQPAVDYEFAVRVMRWTGEHLRSIPAEEEFRGSGLRLMPAGAYVYAEEDRRFIEKNIRLISLISIIGNLVLCLVVYPRIPLLILSLLPTSLGILWTTGVASFYPGEVNLISMSFIAILAGLGDDQIVHFFNRVPQEWARGGSLEEAFRRTYETTGRSIVFCILTAGTATAALATARFRVLAEFGFILTVGMFMIMFHTVLTVPALMRLWWRFSKPRAPETITFRFLPAVARMMVNLVERRPRAVTAVSLAILALATACLPFVKMDRKIEILRGDANPAIAGQKRLSARFGIEGSPDVLLISGSQEEVLRRSEDLAAKLEEYQRKGVVRSVFAPTGLVPSARTQTERAAVLREIDLEAAARAVESAIRESGFQPAPFRPFVDRLREIGRGNATLTLEKAAEHLPAGLLDNSIRRTGDGKYLLALAFYGTDPDATEIVPESVLASWRRETGPFLEFSFDKVNRDVQRAIMRDSGRALWLTSAGILLIVYLIFRNIRTTLLVLLPITFAVVVTFGLLYLVGHRFSFMALTAVPLIVGIGIDNGIHLVRRYLETDRAGIVAVAHASGAALIQSNLTTIVGFGALMASSFEPLAEMGLVTSLGVALALLAALWVVPGVILAWHKR